MAETPLNASLGESPAVSPGLDGGTIVKVGWERCDERQVDGFFDRTRQNLHCRIACKGKDCPHEDYTKNLNRKGVHPAIEGLNSNFVGDVAVASQRPSTSLFLKHLLIDQFRAKQVKGVFNLQEKGEHAYCGPDGIYAESGYSYVGDRDLQHYGIYYYEFPWADMTAPENDVVLRSVQCMDHHISVNKGRVLVHCHAGLGRTGLMIACYFILAQRMPAKEAIQLVRLSRPGSIQTTRQTQFCHGFEKHVFELANAFRMTSLSPPVEFDDFLKRQYLLLHGEEARTYRYIPRHIVDLLVGIVAICDSEAAELAQRMPAKEAIQLVRLSILTLSWLERTANAV